MDEPLTLEHVAILINERHELLAALRELHEYALPHRSHLYRERSQRAFDNAVKLLKKFETSDQG